MTINLRESALRSISFKTLETNYHKPQRFVFRKGIALEEDEDDKIPKKCRADFLLGDNMVHSNIPPVLTFTAYFCDKLGEGYKSTTTFRNCRVIYFLDDDEIKVYEPRHKNSGLLQGVIISKGKYEKPEGGLYSVDDLNIGESLILNGREIKLTNCDKFTRRFLTEMGYRVKSPQPEILDPLTEDRDEANIARSYRKPYVKDYKLAPFYKNHPKQLRFYGYYGDEKYLFETKKEITLYFDLSHGTIKIVEERCFDNWIGGKSDTRILLKPILVPKRLEPSLPPGEMGDPTLLNLAHDIKSILISGKYYTIQNPTSILVDSNSLQGRKKEIEYFKDTDLHLGLPLNIFGSQVILYDCDEFTKNYYRATYNRELVPVSLSDDKSSAFHKLIYKHEEFGVPEQTITTGEPFKSKPSDGELVKFFKHDKYGYDVQELKFLARVITEDPVEKLYHYLVCWLLVDDTMTIRALDEDNQNRNIIKRMRVIKPHSLFENSGRCFYRPADMYVGSIIYVKGNAYELLEADEYTYDYMEKHCDMFPLANVKKILSGLKECITPKCGSFKSALERKDTNKSGYITYSDFRDALYSEMPKEIQHQYPEHAIKTVARYYVEDEYIGLQFCNLVREVQTELYRKKFYDFEDLRLAFKLHDSEKEGYLDPDRIYYVLRSTSIPLNRDLLKSFIYKFPKTENKVNYTCLVETLDWINYPAEFYKNEPRAIQINWERKETEKNLDKIKYNCFLIDIVSP